MSILYSNTSENLKNTICSVKRLDHAMFPMPTTVQEYCRIPAHKPSLYGLGLKECYFHSNRVQVLHEQILSVDPLKVGIQ